MIPPTPATDEALERARRADAVPRAAPRRPARPAGREPGRRASASPSSPSATAATLLRAGMAEILDYAERRTRGRARRAARRHPRGRGRARGRRRRRASATSRLRVEATIDGDSPRARLRGHRRPGRGQPQLPALGDQVGRVLRGPGPDRPRRAAVGRRLPADRGDRAPQGCLLNARSPAAVAAGNVETSSRVADLVIAALGGARPVPAQGQGTMNNLTLAGEGFTYYETLGGGQGACPTPTGPSAIHVAMSNTLNTPTEALETEFPLRVRELGVRRGSGGDGRASRRRRARPRDRGAGADALHADHRAPPPSRRAAARAAPTERRAATS